MTKKVQQNREEEKKRLVDLLKDFDKPNEDEWDEEELEFYRDEEAVEELERLYGELADHLLSKGVIVPPCKVGDTVYKVWPDGYIQERIINQIEFGKYGMFIRSGGLGFADGDACRTIFLTREEAVAALERMQK